jgi:hypothetical protein
MNAAVFFECVLGERFISAQHILPGPYKESNILELMLKDLNSEESNSKATITLT